jgi:hypothetical protein
MEEGKKDRRVVYVVAGLALVEVPLVHLIVAQLSQVAAWAVTGITLALFAWLLAIAVRGARGAERVNMEPGPAQSLR